MAGLAHMGVGLAAKRFAPDVPVGILVVSAFAIDIVWGAGFIVGLDRLSQTDQAVASPWSHSLFMAVVWSGIAALLAQRFYRNRRISIIIGLVVFSHWIVDFFSHPMTAIMPDAAGLPLFFGGSPVVGLGLWSTPLAVGAGESVLLIGGLVIYLLTRARLQQEKQLHARENAGAGRP
jgi:hypothetical protein